MSKIITVCGSSGSGKSLLSCILAEELSAKDEVLLINYSADVPMHPVWQPLQQVNRIKSLGNVLSSAEINIATLSESIEIHEKNKDIGLLGYVSGNTPMDFIDNTCRKSLDLIKSAMNITDGYIIIDCCSDFNDVFRPAAIEMADTALMTLTPDLRGLQYYCTQKELLMSSPVFKFNEMKVLAGNAKEYYPLVEMGLMIENGFFGVLDYIEDLERSALQGDMFTCSGFLSSSYQTALDKLLAVIE